MRILILSQYFPPEIGAPQVRLSAMARELTKLGHNVEVVTAMPNHPTGRIFEAYRRKFYKVEDIDGIKIHRVWVYASVGAGLKRMINYMSFTLTSLIGLVRSRKPDCIFVESPPLFLSIPAYIAACLWRVPFVFNVADLWPDSVVELGLMKDGPVIRIAEWLEKWTYRKAHAVNAVTEGIKSDLLEKKRVPELKVSFLPNGADTELFKPREPERDLAEQLGLVGKKVILYAGTLGFAQGLETALHAMNILMETDPEVLLVFIGDGSEKKKLVEVCERQKLCNVKFIDPHPPEYVARLYSLAYAGFASLKNIPLFEGARPSKIFPIMSSGKPVIYSGFGEGARLVEQADAGTVVPPEDADQLARAIRDLVNDTGLAAEKGRNGRQYVEQHLSWDTLMKAWITWLEKNTLGVTSKLEAGTLATGDRSERLNDPTTIEKPS